MSTPTLLLLVLATWIGLVAVVRWGLLPLLERGPVQDPIVNLLWWANRVYTRLMHRVTFDGQEKLRRRRDHGGLIIVSNHTSGVDPLLIQAACHFEVRWMMAADMMIDALAPLWERLRIIPVDREGRDRSSLREAIRHVKSGGAIGIFPEGRIVTRGEIRPFLSGVGLLVARTNAPVLLVWITGTPETEDLRTSFVTPSRSRVRFVKRVNYTRDQSAQDITRDLRERISQASGWPLNDEPLTPGGRGPALRQGSHDRRAEEAPEGRPAPNPSSGPYLAGQANRCTMTA